MNGPDRLQSFHPLLPWVPLALLLAAAPAQLHAGAWTQPQGGFYSKLAGLSFSSVAYLDLDGERQDRAEDPRGELSDRGYSAYLEYGLLERLTLVASLPYKSLEFRNPTEARYFEALDSTIVRQHPDQSASGLADLELRLRWRLLLEPAVSLAAGGKLPLGYEVPTEIPESYVPLGTGETDAEVRLLVGTSLYPVPGYVTGTLGYRRRGGEYGDELFHGLEGGYSFDRLLLKGVIEGIQTLGDCGATGEGGGLVGDQNNLKLSPGLIWSLSDRVEISADLFHIVSGCNTAAGTTYALGLAFKG